MKEAGEKLVRKAAQTFFSSIRWGRGVRFGRKKVGGNAG